MKAILILIISLLLSNINYGQSLSDPNPKALKKSNNQNVKNIILLIGDGMGVAHIYAAITANGGNINLDRFKNIGFSKTCSASNYVTDSGAGGTAISTGYKTYNGAIGVDKDTLTRKTILEFAEENHKSTGLVVTCAVTHATPASFIAHQPSRENLEEIALAFLKTDIEILFGGGLKNFKSRKDQKDLTMELASKGYQMVYSPDSIKFADNSKIAGLLYEEHGPKYSEGRGDMLLNATEKAIEVLNLNNNGFFLMIEGSQIDWGGHDNDIEYIVNEMLDFDRVIGKVLDFAERDKNTLVIVTSDHETGGLSLNDGNIKNGNMVAKFTTGEHTGVMVPVFGFGPGSENFRGIYDNTEIFTKMMASFGFNYE